MTVTVTAPPSSAVKALSDVFTYGFKSYRQLNWYLVESHQIEVNQCVRAPGVALSGFPWYLIPRPFPHPPRCAAPHTRRTSGTVRLHQRLSRTTRTQNIISAGNVIEPESTTLIFFVSQFPLVSLCFTFNVKSL